MSFLKKLIPRSSKSQPSHPALKIHNPSQRSLNLIFERVTRIRILKEGVSQGKALGTELLLEETDPQAIFTLRECLAIVEDPHSFGHCMCLGDQALELYAGDRLRATIGLHHGRSIRWEVWKYDALLVDGKCYLNWMAERGVTGPLEVYLESQRREEIQRQALTRWQQAMPECLYPFADEMLSTSGGMATFIPLVHQGPPGRIEEVISKLGSLLNALALAYPDVQERILGLFQWYGSGLGPWSGFPAYERITEELLLAFPLDQVLHALTHSELTPIQLEGAARFFAGYYFRRYRSSENQQIPSALKKRLLEHSLDSEDEDKIQRATNAFTYSA